MQQIQIMNSRKERIRTDDLIAKLQKHKGEIMKEEERAKQQMKFFFKDLQESIQIYETQISKKFDEEVLNFHEGATKTIKILSALKNNADDESIENAEEVLNCQVIDGIKIDREKLKELLREVYYLRIGAFHQDSKMEVPEIMESQSSFQDRMYNQVAVERLQSERDYYQRREQELMQKIKEMQFGRKGANIRQLSKSALEEKCSRWAIERLKEEKRVLVEKIGEASQQIMKQDGLLSQQQQQIKKLTSVINEMGGKSFVGTSSIKGSVVLESEINHDRSMELQTKNTQLTIQLTNYMHRLEEIYQANKQYQNELEQKTKENQNLRYQITDLQNECSLINNDYEANLRKKATVEQQFTELKKNYEDLNNKLEEQRQGYKSVVEGLEAGEKEIKERLKRIEAEKKGEITSLQQKLVTSQLQKEKLLKKLDDVTNKTGQDINYRQLLNDQITRLLKQNASMEKELHIKEEQMFEAKQESRRLDSELKQQAKKFENLKKDCFSLKKTNKQLEKQLLQIRNRVSLSQNLEIRVLQIDQNLATLNSEFIKYKQISQRRSNQQEKVMTIVKERFKLQLSQLLCEQTKKLKKQKPNKIEIVDKYIEQMINFSSKTAQIKQLKDQIRELKDYKEGKQVKEVKKRQKSTLEETVISLQWSMWTTNNNIFEERLRNQKELYELKINEGVQLAKKEEVIKKGLIQDLQRQRAVIAELKLKQKQQRPIQENIKNTKQLQQKIEMLSQQVQRLKIKNKKLQSDLSDAQSQSKTKKELNTGLKNQIKIKEDSIVQLYKQIDDLKGQIAKQQRNTRQMSNKEQLLRQSKDSLRRMEEQYKQLLESFDELSEKNKQLNRQLSKKDEVIKQLSFIQQKQVKRKEDILVRSISNEITDLKQSIRKLKMDNDRKDEIIKNNRSKIQNKNKENQELISKSQKQYERMMKQKESLQRKLQSLTSTLKRQQLKLTNLSWAIKKVFEMCCQGSITTERQQSKIKPLTTQYYTNSSISPHTLKLGTPASNIKSYISCEGLDILNLRPEDIQECLGLEATIINKTQLKNESWSMASPIINKRKQQQRKESLMEGLEQLQRLLTAKEINNALLIDQFKRILEK